MVVFLGDLCYNKIPEALKIKDLCKLQIRPLGHGIRRPSVQICTPQPRKRNQSIGLVFLFRNYRKKREDLSLRRRDRRETVRWTVEQGAGQGA